MRGLGDVADVSEGLSVFQPKLAQSVRSGVLQRGSWGMDWFDVRKRYVRQ